MLTKIRKTELILLIKFSQEKQIKEIFEKDIIASVNINDEKDVALYFEYVEQNIESFTEDIVIDFTENFAFNHEEEKFATKEIHTYTLNVVKELINMHSTL